MPEPQPQTPESSPTQSQAAGNQQTAAKSSVELQPTAQQRAGQNYGYDWRVKLTLAPGATYLYKDSGNAILAPLATSNGVVFPYMPTISTNYAAKYDAVDLTHSNYRGYFYKNSSVENISVNGTFTAQNTAEAAYVLAVIHFFRSVTKMFYGQDAQRGSPPPLVFLSGLGDYQFNNHACLVSQFNYTLPPDVDYISSGSPNNLGLNLQPLQNLYSTTLNATPTSTREYRVVVTDVNGCVGTSPSHTVTVVPDPINPTLNTKTPNKVYDRYPDKAGAKIVKVKVPKQNCSCNCGNCK